MADNTNTAPVTTATPDTSNTAQDGSQSTDTSQGTQAVANAAQSVVSDPNATKAQKVEAKKMLKSLQLKIDGKNYTENLPFEIEDTEANRDYMTRQLQMGKMGQSRAQEKAVLEKQVREFITQLRTNPEKVLSDPNIGVDIKKFAAKVIEQEIENSKKSPHQLETEKLQAELQAVKESKDREMKDMQEREFSRLQSQEYERYDLLMTQALDTSDLPKTPYVVKKMADYMLLAINNGIDASPADVLPLVREEILGDLQSMFQIMPENVIEKMIGKETVNKLRKKAMATSRQTGKLPGKINDVGSAPKPKTEVAKPKIPYAKFFGGI